MPRASDPATPASTRPKRAASSSPSKLAQDSPLSKKAKLSSSSSASTKDVDERATKLVAAEDVDAAAVAATAADADADLDLLDDEDGLDTELLMEAAEQAEREAAAAAAVQKQTLAKSRPASARAAAGGGGRANAGAGNTSTNGASTSAMAAKPAGLVANKDSDDEVHTIEKEWRSRLQAELKKDYYLKLKQFIASERKAGKTIYPPTHLVHNWSRLTPLRSVKVVVVGQDRSVVPAEVVAYHGPGQACGHSFSVPRGVAVPASLRNIYKELSTEYPSFTPPKHGCLDGWANQGVLLLNACLTVYGGQAGSHSGKGWETFTREILKLVAAEAASGGGGRGGGAVGSGNSIKKSAANPFGWSTVGTSKSIAAAGGKAPVAASSQKGGSVAETAKSSKVDRCKGVVFLVWGQPAAKTVAAAGITEKSPNVLILRSPHPSPLSAHRGFLGNGHFKKANDWLETVYGPGGGIDWAAL
ncbi:hypothetical protein V8E36_003627 [Tilletia maclaganii]